MKTTVKKSVKRVFRSCFIVLMIVSLALLFPLSVYADPEDDTGSSDGSSTALSSDENQEGLNIPAADGLGSDQGTVNDSTAPGLEPAGDIAGLLSTSPTATPELAPYSLSLSL